jgi:hypothetical protein
MMQHPAVCVMPKRNLHLPHDFLIYDTKNLFFQIANAEWGRGSYCIISRLQFRDFDVGFRSASKVYNILVPRRIFILQRSR